MIKLDVLSRHNSSIKKLFNHKTLDTSELRPDVSGGEWIKQFFDLRSDLGIFCCEYPELYFDWSFSTTEHYLKIQNLQKQITEISLFIGRLVRQNMLVRYEKI